MQTLSRRIRVTSSKNDIEGGTEWGRSGTWPFALAEWQERSERLDAHSSGGNWLEKQHHTTSFSFEQTPHRGLTNPGVCKLTLP